jgi:hypothetical protein
LEQLQARRAPRGKNGTGKTPPSLSKARKKVGSGQEDHETPELEVVKDAEKRAREAGHGRLGLTHLTWRIMR